MHFKAHDSHYNNAYFYIRRITGARNVGQKINNGGRPITTEILKIASIDDVIMVLNQ